MPEVNCGFHDGPLGSGADLLAAHGPTLLVDIGFDPDYSQNEPARIPSLQATTLMALVDTGATESCIDSQLATQLNLPIVDRRHIGGVSGLYEVNVYLAHIHIPQLSFTLYGSFAGVDLIAGGQVHYALIGRTFLRHFTMIYDGHSGNVIISNNLPKLDWKRLQAQN